MRKVLTVEDPASSMKTSVIQVLAVFIKFLTNYKFVLDIEINFAHMSEEMLATVNAKERVKIQDGAKTNVKQRPPLARYSF